MDDQDLRKLIEILHAEIQNTQTVDKKDRELLAHLDSDIRKLLAEVEKTNTPAVHPSTLRRLEQGLDQFELTHPTLTILLSKLLEALSTAGI
jgi:hypothetical protein